MSDLHRRIINLLRDARRQASLTQAQLGERLGRKANFVFRYENGSRRLDIAELILICRALGIDPHELLRQAEGHG